MNYEQIVTALKGGNDLVAIFEGDDHYDQGDEYPLRVNSDFSSIVTGAMKFYCFTPENNGSPEGVKTVCLLDRSPFSVKVEKEGMVDREWDLYAFIKQGLIPEDILKDLQVDDLSYKFKDQPVRLMIKLIEKENEIAIARFAFKGMLCIGDSRNPKSLIPFDLSGGFFQYLDFEDDRWKPCDRDRLEYFGIEVD